MEKMWLPFLFFSILIYRFCNGVSMYTFERSVSIDCGVTEPLNNLKPFDKEIKVPDIVLQDCPNPNDTYKNILNNLHINTDYVKSLLLMSQFKKVPEEMFEWQFDYLNPGTTVHVIQFYSDADYIEFVFVAQGVGKTNISNGEKLIIYNNFDSDKSMRPNILILNRKLYTSTVDWTFWSNDLTKAISLKEILDAANIVITSANVILKINSKYSENEAVLPAPIFTNMQLESLSIKTTEYKINLDVKIFENNLNTLKEIDFYGVNIPSLPEDNYIEAAKLENGVSLDRFGSCCQLRTLKMRNWRFLQDNHMERCIEIVEIHLEDLLHEDVDAIVTSMSYVKKLFINDCMLIEYIPLGINQKFIFLKHLDLKKNNLNAVNIAHTTNGLFTWTGSSKMRNLQTLILDENPLGNFCKKGFIENTYAKELSLQNTGLTRLCFREFREVQIFNLTNSKITELEFTEFPLASHQSIIIDLRGNPLQSFGKEEKICQILDSNDSFMYKDKNMTVLVNWRLKCDCEGGCVSRALREYPRLHLEGALCDDDVPFHSKQPQHIARLECDKYLCSKCTCRRSWVDNSVAADCTEVDLRFIPYEVSLQPNLTKLIAAGNKIASISEDDLPYTLAYIDLRDNGPMRVDKIVSDILFSVPERKLLMSGTFPVCACDESRFWIEALQAHKSMIGDYDKIVTTCFGKEIPLKELNMETFCNLASQYWFWLVLLALVGTISLALSFAFNSYERQIKIFLYIHGLCLFWLTEEDIDTDKVFDAFISFCHEDDEFVHDKIIPELSEFKLCIHYRDWHAGDWIPAQIARSIDQSKRTIIIMSNNFLKSRWGLMEFRMAHASTAEEGRSRVIVVLVDNIFESSGLDLDAELRSYLASNTYVKWGDPWFFEKVRFALPRRKKDAEREVAINDLRLAAAIYRRDGPGEHNDERNGTDLEAEQ